MIVKNLVKLLNKICKNHPEAKQADVWFYREPLNGGDPHPVNYVGYDQRHTPSRMKLEE